jgi:hypothetical protein
MSKSIHFNKTLVNEARQSYQTNNYESAIEVIKRTPPDPPLELLQNIPLESKVEIKKIIDRSYFNATQCVPEEIIFSGLGRVLAGTLKHTLKLTPSHIYIYQSMLWGIARQSSKYIEENGLESLVGGNSVIDELGGITWLLNSGSLMIVPSSAAYLYKSIGISKETFNQARKVLLDKKLIYEIARINPRNKARDIRVYLIGVRQPYDIISGGATFRKHYELYFSYATIRERYIDSDKGWVEFL